jgi:hypothetical protein
MRSHQWAQVLHTLLRAMTFFTLCTQLRHLGNYDCCEHRHFELLVRNIVTKEITEESAVPAGWVAGRDGARRTWLGWRQVALP